MQNEMFDEKYYHPNQWMKEQFPNVFEGVMDECFKMRASGFASILSPYQFSKCLGPVGSPETPILYSGEARQYFGYSASEGIYKNMTEDEVQQRVFELLDECGRSMASTEHVRAMQSLQSPKHVGPVVQALRGDPSFPDPSQRRDLRYLHLSNGVLDLETLDLLPFSPARPATWKLPVEWKPDSPYPGQFWKMMGTLFPDDADLDLAIRVLSSAFLGNPFQRLVLITGAAGTGKTSLVRMLSALLGPGASAGLRLTHVNCRFTPLTWAGRLLLYASELEQSELNVGLPALKALSGHDPITGEKKYARDTITFVPRALPVLVSNHADLRLPAGTSATAVSRRLVAFDVPEPRRPLDAKSHFVEDLIAAEGPAILSVFLTTAHRLRKADTLGPMTARQVARNHRFLGLADPLMAWAEERVERVPRGQLKRDDAIPSAHEWLTKRNLLCPSSTAGWSRRLKPILLTMGGTWAESLGTQGQDKGWRGLALR